VKRECAYDSELSTLLLQKVQKYFLDDIEVEAFEVRGLKANVKVRLDAAASARSQIASSHGNTSLASRRCRLSGPLSFLLRPRQPSSRFMRQRRTRKFDDPFILWKGRRLNLSVRLGPCCSMQKLMDDGGTKDTKANQRAHNKPTNEDGGSHDDAGETTLVDAFHDFLDVTISPRRRRSRGASRWGGTQGLDLRGPEEAPQ
jgi:hypothetical protein